MHATTLVDKKFDPSAEKEDLSLMCKKYGEIRNNNNNIREQIAKIQLENDKIVQRLFTYGEISLEDRKKCKHLHETKQNFATKSKENICFNIYRSISGYALLCESWNNEQQSMQVTWYYNEKCFVRFALASNGLMDLIEIVPTHNNFLNLRRFLLLNQDIVGLLTVMLKYFKYLEIETGSSQ